MEALTRKVWQGLPEQDKQEWMRRIELLLPEGMKYEGLQTFERYGQRTQTGVFAHDEQRFVFVPGDQVTLGKSGITEWIRKLLRNCMKPLVNMEYRMSIHF